MGEKIVMRGQFAGILAGIRINETGLLYSSGGAQSHAKIWLFGRIPSFPFATAYVRLPPLLFLAN